MLKIFAFVTIALASASLLFNSCSATDNASTARSDVGADSIAVVDSVPADSTEIETQIILPDHKFANAAEAHQFMNSTPDSAAYAEGILHRMADDYLPYAQKLLENTYPRFIIADKWAMKVRLFDRFGRMEKEYGMACAKNFGTKHKKADSRTPEGFFSVEGIYDSTDWLFTDDDGYTSPKKGQFGPRFIRLRIPGTSQIGIHGTCSPWSIGSRASHGCMRVTNENILELVQLVEPGMPVIVNPSKRDTQINLGEGYDVPWISSSTDPRYPRPTPIFPVEEVDTIAVPVDTLPASVVTEPVESSVTECDSIVAAAPAD